MKSIEIVTHCFAGKIEAYAFHLLYQASSLLWYPPLADVTLTVFWAGEKYDPFAANVIDHIVRRRSEVRGDIVFNLLPIVLPREQLFRRAIGRHQRSQETLAEVLWYCDADYAFNDGCIDGVLGQVHDDGRIYFPHHTMISVDHNSGADLISRAGDWPRIHDTAAFKSQRNRVAIGGIQILGRETAKRLGYLGTPGSKWQRPVDPEKPFACFRDDSSWRRQHFPLQEGKQVKINATNLFRIRHEFSSLRPAGFGVQ